MNRTKLDPWIEETEGLPHLTREALETLQLQRLNETLQRVKQRGGFYKNYPARLSSLKELSTLPFTTAQMLADQPGKFLVTSQSEVSRVISGATSGTTGAAKRVFYTQLDAERTVGLYRCGIGEMLRPGEKCFIGFPFTGNFGLGDLIAQAVTELGGIPIPAGFGGSWKEWMTLVKAERPETYIGFPVPLLGLARRMGANFPIQRALISGDACPEGVVAQLEQVLGSRVYPHYGSREMGLAGAVTCPAFAGMHLRENHIIPEIIDERGNVLPEGSFGELVITTIGADAMPLIRYRTGDYTRFLPSCPCGGVTRRLDRVSRREGEISMERLDSHLFSLPELVDYRATLADDTLQLDARLLDLSATDALCALAQEVYPQLHVTLTAAIATPEERPMYLGKRHVIIP